MSLKITAHSLEIIASQKLDLPTGARLLSVNLDHRFNKGLLSTLQDDDAKTESVEFFMARLGETVAGGDYVGTLKDNAGYVHVFAKWPKLTIPLDRVVAPMAIPAAKPALAEAAK